MKIVGWGGPSEGGDQKQPEGLREERTCSMERKSRTVREQESLSVSSDKD